MYKGQKCGECVCIKCDPKSKGGCKSDKSFLHIRQDNAYNFPTKSNEVTTNFYNNRWNAGGEQAVYYYQNKEVSSCDPRLCV